MTSPAEQTLLGSYRVVDVDGEPVVLQKVGGRWVTTEERLEQERAETFTDRFKDTAFAPAPASGVETDTLTIKPEAVMARHQETSRHLDAYLGEILGSPEEVLARTEASMARVKKVKDTPQIMRQVLGLIMVFRDPRWNRVRDEVLCK